MSGSVDHDGSSIIVSIRIIVIFGNSLLESIALMLLQITLAWYVAFDNHVTPWSTDCVIEVVFGDKRVRYMTINPGTCWLAGQLSTINATFQNRTRNFWSTWLKISLIPSSFLFAPRTYTVRTSRSWNILGFWLFQW